MTMRFNEVTERLGSTIRDPGGCDDGKPLNIAVPHLGKVRIWQAVHGGYTWVIQFEPGLANWTTEEKACFVGYSASYRRVDHRRSSQTIRIDGGPWDSFVKAESACQRVWKQLRNAS